LQRKTKTAWDSLRPNEQHSQGVNWVGSFPGKVAEANSGYRRVWMITIDPTPQQNELVMKMLGPQFWRPVQRGCFPGAIKIKLLPRAAS